MLIGFKIKDWCEVLVLLFIYLYKIYLYKIVSYLIHENKGN